MGPLWHILRLAVVAVQQNHDQKQMKKADDGIHAQIRKLADQFDLATESGLNAALASLESREKGVSDAIESARAPHRTTERAIVDIPRNGFVKMTFPMSEPISSEFGRRLAVAFERDNFWTKKIVIVVEGSAIAVQVGINHANKVEGLHDRLDRAVEDAFQIEIQETKALFQARRLRGMKGHDELRLGLIAYSKALRAG